MGKEHSVPLMNEQVLAAFRPGWEDRLRYSYESIPVERLKDLDQRLDAAARVPVIYPNKVTIGCPPANPSGRE